jgi:chloride channel, nucleotide-sensitive, 1A
MQGLYLQLAIPSEEISEEDEDDECLALTIVPPPLAEVATSELESSMPGVETAALTLDEMAGSGDRPEVTTQALFAAVSACSNLHPDPANSGIAGDYRMNEQGSSLFQSGLISAGCSDGGLPPPVDGSSRWITAENVHEFFDKEGDWIWEGEAPSASLGSGAGTVRSREVDNDGAGDCEETKWRKTG